MGKYDGKVSIGTALDNKGLKKDIGSIDGPLGGLKSVVGKLCGAIAAAFSIKAIVQFGAESSKAAMQLSDAMTGLQSILDGQGRSFSGAKAFLEDYVKDGLIPMVNAAAAYKNLAMRGYDDSQIQKTLVALKNSAAFGRQASLTMGEAVQSASEGLKNENSILVDNAGVTKNVAKMWDEYAKSVGTTANNLTQQQKIQAEVTGILEESKYQTGDAAKVAGTLSGQLQQLSFNFNNLKIAVGNIVNPIVQAFLPAVNSAISAVTRLANAIATTVGSIFGKAVVQTNAIAESAAAGAEAQKDLSKGVTEAGKAAKKSTAGFDELNVLQSQKGTGAGTQTSDTGDSKTVTTTVSTPALSGVSDAADKVLETMEAILVLVGLVGAGILAWKILDAYTAGVSLMGVLKSVKGVFVNIGSIALIVAGAILLIKGYCDGWVNGIDWKNLLITLGGIALILSGITIKFGTFGLSIGLVASGVALLVLGIKDFIENGPSLQNTILILGGAVAVAVGLATAGVSVLVAAIIGAIAAVVAFTAAILLEEPAIMSVEEAQEKLTAAKEAAAAAENDYINAVDGAESALNRLKDAEEAAGITGAELYAQVQSGKLDYANMTAAQKEVYKAYLDNEEKQKTLAESTAALNEAKKAETLASLENEIALGKEAGSYDKCKESILAAYNEGTISAEECRDLLAKSMSEMSDDAQQTFMEDIPGDIKEGLDPNKYETTRKKMGDWFAGVGKFFSEQIWKPIKDWWNRDIAPIFTKKYWSDKFNTIKEGAKTAFNNVMGIVEDAINSIIKKINTLSWNIPDWVPIIGGGTFGFNFKEIKIPRLAQGAVIPPNREFMAVLGDQRHGTNIEAPLETIKQALAEVMATQGSGDVTINFTGDLAQLARVLKPVIEKEGRRTGTSLAKGAQI